MTAPPRFYRLGNLPPRPDDMAKVQQALRHAPLTKQSLIQQAGLSQNRTFCAVDALIASGEVAYDAEVRHFSLSQPR
jgi:hypothetical protein